MTEEEWDELERPLIDQLIMLKQYYDEAAAPIIRRLVDIRNMRPKVFNITLANAIAAGLIK